MGAERVDYFGQIRASSAAGSTSVESNHVNVWLSLAMAMGIRITNLKLRV